MKIANYLVMFLLFVALPVYSQTAIQANSDSASVIAARSQYARADAAPSQDAGAGNSPLAQAPRSGHFHLLMRAAGMAEYPGTYPYAGESSGRHVLIGALIGFGLGAAIGAKGNTDQHPGAGVKCAFLVGGVGALIGAAIGSGVPSFPSRYRRGRWPDNDENASSRGRRKTGHPTAASRPRRRDPEETASAPLAKEAELDRPASE